MAVSEHGIQMGAIAGYSWAGVAEIKQLWVDGDHRGHGVGRRLLDAAIGEAVIRDCYSIWTLSYDFQAPGFYEKHGFERVAELRDWPPGHTHIVHVAALKPVQASRLVADPNRFIAEVRWGHQTLNSIQ